MEIAETYHVLPMFVCVCVCLYEPRPFPFFYIFPTLSLPLYELAVSPFIQITLSHNKIMMMRFCLVKVCTLILQALRNL